MLSLNNNDSPWQTPVLTAQALNNIGITELYEEIGEHRSTREKSGQLALRRQEHLKKELLQAIEQGFSERLHHLMERDHELMELAEKVKKGEVDPYSTARDILHNQSMLDSWLSDM